MLLWVGLCCLATVISAAPTTSSTDADASLINGTSPLLCLQDRRKEPELYPWSQQSCFTVLAKFSSDINHAMLNGADRICSRDAPEFKNAYMVPDYFDDPRCRGYVQLKGNVRCVPLDLEIQQRLEDNMHQMVERCVKPDKPFVGAYWETGQNGDVIMGLKRVPKEAPPPLEPSFDAASIESSK